VVILKEEKNVDSTEQRERISGIGLKELFDWHKNLYIFLLEK
jgi:hypothetical protein